MTKTLDTDNKFTITWRDGKYFVSIPNYDGGDVYKAEYVEALKDTIAKLKGQNNAMPEVTIALRPVTGSSLIAADGWDDSKTTLRVQFQSNGKVFDYAGLSPDTHDAYENAPSKGQYLKRHIEPNIKGVAVAS